MPDADPTTMGFSAITVSDGPSASAFSAIMQSLGSEAASSFSAALAGTSTIATSSAKATPASSASGASSKTTSTAVVAASRPSSSAPTTLSTSTLSPQSSEAASSIPSPTINTPSGTATNAAQSVTPAAAITEEHECDSVSCNSGLQAAIAVPVVIGLLLILAIFFFLARRRRRRPRTPPPPINEKAKPKKKWSRHLRVFSFGEELLMGGRFSSTNSLRTGETSSVRSGQHSSHSGHAASIHSVEEVAPPYRDAVVERPAGAGIISDPFPRSSSSATAPPPYAAAAIAAAGRASRNTNRDRPTTPISTHSQRDPFRDALSSPVSPIEGEESPFNDPADEDAQSPRPLISRQSSTLSHLRDDRSESTLQGSEAGSIHEAQVARNLSTRGARAIDVNRNGSLRGSQGS